MPATPIALEDINRGAAADDGNGDPLRTGALRHNDNASKIETAINNAFDVLGVDTTADAMLGSDVKTLIEGLQTANSKVFDREFIWSPGETVIAGPPVWAPQDLVIESIELFITGAVPDSAGTILLSAELQGSPDVELINAGPIDIEGQPVGVQTLTLIGSVPAWDEGAEIVLSLASNNVDMTAGGISVRIVATPV